MTWFRVDDAFAIHPKAVAAGNAALGLWVRAGAWCSGNLTDGRFAKAMVHTFGGQKRDCDKLIAAGLWVPVGEDSSHDLHTSPTPGPHQTHTDGTRDSAGTSADGCSLCAGEPGYQFNDWADWQYTKAQVRAKREADKSRQQAHREGRRHGVTDAVTPAVTHAVSHDALTEPNRSSNELPTPSLRSGAARKRATRIPDDFVVNDDMRKWATARGFNDNQIAEMTERFADYWHGVAGSKGAKLDWPATWRNWVGKEDPSRVRGVTLRVVNDAHLPGHVVADLLGPDVWSPPRGPDGLDADELWEWNRARHLEHIAERQAAARAKLAAGA